MKQVLTETLTQLRILLPLTAIILLALLLWRAPAWGWTWCFEIGGSTYCWDFPDE